MAHDRLIRRAAPFLPQGEHGVYAFRAERPRIPWRLLTLAVLAGALALALPGPDWIGWAIFFPPLVAVALNLAERRILLIASSSVVVLAERGLLAPVGHGSLALVAQLDPPDVWIDDRRFAYAVVVAGNEKLLVVNSGMAHVKREIDRALQEADKA